MSNLVHKNQYAIPEEVKQRQEFAVKMIWSGLVIVAFFIAATIFVGVSDPSGVLPMVLLTVVPGLAICLWGFWWHIKEALFSYDAAGVEVIFVGPEYYVPQEKMEKLVKSVYHAWSGIIDNPRAAYQGVTLEVLGSKPIRPSDNREVVGLTWHQQRMSQIWGPYVLNRGGAAYELLLHGADHAWPSDNEGLHIHLMKKEGVFDRLKEAFESNELE